MTDNAIAWHDSIAKRFARRYTDGKLFRDRYQVWSRWLLKYCDAARSGGNLAALDLGCGAGNFSRLLARHCTQLTCVDGSQEMATLCRSALVAEGCDSANVQVMDINTFCLASTQRFDVICCSSVLEYVDDLPQTLGNIRRCLDGAGVLLFSIPNAESVYRRFERALYRITGKPSYYRYVKNTLSLADVTRLLAQQRFDVIEAEYLTDAPWIGRALILLGVRRSKSLILLACQQREQLP